MNLYYLVIIIYFGLLDFLIMDIIKWILQYMDLRKMDILKKGLEKQ